MLNWLIDKILGLFAYPDPFKTDPWMRINLDNLTDEEEK